MAAGRNRAARGAALDRPQKGRFGPGRQPRKPATDDRDERTLARANHRACTRHAGFRRHANAASSRPRQSHEWQEHEGKSKERMAASKIQLRRELRFGAYVVSISNEIDSKVFS